MTLKDSSHGTPCAVKAARTVWGGAKGLKEPDLSPSGPKPADSEMLLGEIRSRNISMVPILQDISQLKTLFPQDKWEIFSSNCSAVAYLGSGPTAYTTHKWMSDMLGETTIDTRSETISSGRNGSGSLQNSKAGMKLMTPEQVREMPNHDCILLIEGRKPVYDRKNRPFHTRIWKEAEAAAGPDGYTHPVRVIHDKEKDVYKTIDCEEKILMIDKEEEEFYRNAAKTDKSIHIFDMDEEEFLYLNWDEQKPLTPEELQAIVRQSQKRDVSGLEVPEDVKRAEERQKSIDADTSEEKEKTGELTAGDAEGWDLSGGASAWLGRYADRIPEEELAVLLKSLEDGLSDRQIEYLFSLHEPEKTERYRKIFALINR